MNHTEIPANESLLDDPRLYVNRELSWLAFNARVLDQARDTGWPLLERVKFLAIFAANLDEFFMIRVSGLHEQLESQVGIGSSDGLAPTEQLAAIRRETLALTEEAARILTEELLPELARNGLRVRSYGELTPAEREWAKTYFRRSVFPVLTPLSVDPLHPFPFLSNLSLSLAVEAEDPESAELRFARIKVPESLPRFVAIQGDGPGGGYLLLEQLIAGNLEALFPGMTLLGAYPFRVTRDMDLEILEEEADDLLSLVDRQLRKRRFGAAVRLEVTASIPAHIRTLLLQKLEIDSDDLYETRSMLGLAGLMSIATLPRAELRDSPLPARTPAGLDEGSDPFLAIRRRDVLLHHPYDSFAPVLHFLRRAAEDPDVLAIKMTLYRAGANSDAVRLLIRAAEHGKQVAVSIELKARFDEENNIAWARTLERAGVHVFYGAAGLKTHAKVLLVVRREGSELRRYVHMSTGNYNASTARFYTDMGLLTADPEVGEDASELFNTLSGFYSSPGYRRLAVAPKTLRAVLLAKIHEQTERARAGGSARVFAKLNSVVDHGLIRALYEASQAGVKVDLVVRGVCCLRPGLPGISDNVRVRSLLGRFLEHERVFAFGTGSEEQMFLSSADWMPRNLDRRVEILFPVNCPQIRARIQQECVAPLELENLRIYEMRPDGSYERRRPDEGVTTVDAQLQAWVATHRMSIVPTNGASVVRTASAAE